jgi:protein O-GlcNAc transferase
MNDLETAEREIRALVAAGNLLAARRECELLLQRAPHAAIGLRMLAVIESRLGSSGRALAAIQDALKLDPLDTVSLHIQGALLAGVGRGPEALDSYTRAISLAPGNVDTLIARADLLCRAGRLAEGLQDLDRVLALEPENAMALQNAASALHMGGELELAVAWYERLIGVLDAHMHEWPNAAHGLDYALGMLVFCRRTMCAWDGLAALEARLVERVLTGGAAFSPPLSLAVTDDARVHALCARRTWSRQIVEVARASADQRIWRPRPDRLRIAYLSGEFRNHATSWLIARLIEVHDRSRFAVYAFAAAPDDGSAMRRRLAKAFDALIDISKLDDAQAAQTIATHKVDVLVDLSGFLSSNRGGVLARRPAPLAVHFLGHPGPLGAPWFDYFIADGIVLPRDQDTLYDSAIVRLPHSYQVNSDRVAAAERPSREAVGLPPESFVFCGMCHEHKLSPTVFDVWMRILAKVPASVLWLAEENRYVGANLRSEARRRGIDPARLVFAPLVDQAIHMARLPLADLMLDTWPCGAHTTGSDALWAGVPFITRLGSCMASRVGTSLVHAVGLPELAVDTLAEYESLAVDLARSPARLEGIRRKLVENKSTAPLFNTRLYCQHIEAAYDSMWERSASGRAPESFDVPSSA